MAKKTEDVPQKSTQSTESAQDTKFSLARLKEFTAEVKKEYTKIVWPPRTQTATSTLVVVMLVFVISCYLGAVDLLLGKIIGFILK